MHDLIQECAPMIDRCAEDIYKNLHGDGIILSANYTHEMQDIRQETCFQLLDLYHRHPEKFPITAGYLYAFAYFACLRLYRGEFCNSTLRLYYLDHEEVLSQQVTEALPPDLMYEDKLDDQARYRRNLKTRKWLDNHGMQVDDYLGLEFALWWQGCSIRDISLTIKLAKLKTLTHSPKNVTKKLHAAFIELERKTGITRQQLLDVREMALKTTL
jgi:hypothetical protein